jgi:hypothetical protein
MEVWKMFLEWLPSYHLSKRQFFLLFHTDKSAWATLEQFSWKFVFSYKNDCPFCRETALAHSESLAILFGRPYGFLSAMNQVYCSSFRRVLLAPGAVSWLRDSLVGGYAGFRVTLFDVARWTLTQAMSSETLSLFTQLFSMLFKHCHGAKRPLQNWIDFWAKLRLAAKQREGWRQLFQNRKYFEVHRCLQQGDISAKPARQRRDQSPRRPSLT